MKNYYLDTVAVRRLGKALPKHVGTSYTSVFTILELLSGISEQQYKARKAALTNLFNSRMEIDWRMPDEILLKSFKVSKRPDTICGDDIKKIAEELIASTNYEDFKERNRKLQPNINSLTFFDQRLSAQFKKVFSAKTAEIREARLTDKTAKFNPDKARGIRAMAYFVCKKLLPSHLSGLSDEVQKNHDGSIERFIEVWLNYYDTNANPLNEASTNDWADVLHTCYLGSNQGIVFVSDDTKISNLLNRLSPGSSISVDEFSRMYP
jgi:hypothetical protein